MQVLRTSFLKLGSSTSALSRATMPQSIPLEPGLRAPRRSLAFAPRVHALHVALSNALDVADAQRPLNPTSLVQFRA